MLSRMEEMRVEPREETQPISLLSEDKTTKMRASLSVENAEKISQTLPKTAMVHKLLTFKEAKPVTLKKRKLGEEKRLAARGEVEKLLEPGFIREAHYSTWLAIVVLVKKPNRKWRMCADYTNLNKACPKDAYPLLSIEQLLDRASGDKFLSFLDAFSGYNQINMHRRDKDKTTIFRQVYQVKTNIV